jgi:C4-dicarboxylate-specific signal transduction histidine kinase
METFYFHIDGHYPNDLVLSDLSKRNLYRGVAVIFSKSWEGLESIDSKYRSRIYGMRIEFGKELNISKISELTWDITLPELYKDHPGLLELFIPQFKEIIKITRKNQILKNDQYRLQNELKLSAEEYQKSSHQLRSDAENKLKRTQAQLIQSAKLAALGEMSSGVAHEINNPLYIIKGFSKRLMKVLESDSIDSEQALDYLNEIRENSERIIDIIQHFREFSRQSDSKLVKTDICQLIERSYKLYHQELYNHSVMVELDLDKKEVFANIDANRLEQVFINLIGNAKDSIESAHGSSGGTLTTKLVSSGENIKIIFIDNGAGIKESIIDSIFDPFFTTKEQGKGTGLGLSISHQIINELYGTIYCKNNKDIGARFIIELPHYKKENVT